MQKDSVTEANVCNQSAKNKITERDVELTRICIVVSHSVFLNFISYLSALRTCRCTMGERRRCVRAKRRKREKDIAAEIQRENDD